MNKYSLPNLYCPFPSQINKYVDVLEDYSIEWVLSFNLLADESNYKRFSQCKFFFLVANAYPNCQLEELKIISDWMSWLFIWDDQCDMLYSGQKLETIDSYHQRFLNILKGAEVKNEEPSLFHALKNLQQRTIQRGDSKWFNHFVDSVKDYFDGCFEQTKNRIEGIIPDIESYIRIRRLTVAVYLSLDLAEFCNQFFISDFLRENQIFHKLRVMTSDIIGWCNDIYSASREIGDGDVHNLVFMLHHHQSISIELAMERTAEMHDQQVLNLLNIEESLPSFDEQIGAELANYMSWIHSWIRGNLEWYSYSCRYENPKRIEIAEHEDLVKV
jgi:5-epi-alpha-selinene synthase